MAPGVTLMVRSPRRFDSPAAASTLRRSPRTVTDCTLTAPKQPEAEQPECEDHVEGPSTPKSMTSRNLSIPAGGVRASAVRASDAITSAELTPTPRSPLRNREFLSLRGSHFQNNPDP